MGRASVSTAQSVNKTSCVYEPLRCGYTYSHPPPSYLNTHPRSEIHLKLSEKDATPAVSPSARDYRQVAALSDLIFMTYLPTLLQQHDVPND